ncbi:glucan endo-1,3-beta-D-glucosidase [Paucibacter sp. KBW04]|uniref:glycoside hydrolase family 16 protein n=1 Tax=Paucibacter sp. KBW04 TaxID=2153361 RepID=UPI000F5879ED|nr:glycoside hydrolase family 16 protein [Paucibacter sp. KBW04]RQO58449.1 glucan endo-1,3-beta-D-glucosidase [Paucibacter sp. KBW04]
MQSKREGWTLVWHDEFEGDAVDRSKWDFDLGNGFYDYRKHVWVPGWGNEELQYYTAEPENVTVADSLLTLRAVKAPLHGCGYTSARLKTRKRDGAPLFTKLYGRFEFRAKVPWGKGLWPALWLLPQDDRYGGWAASGEIDVMEIVGEKPQQVLNSIHFGSEFPARSLLTHVHDLPSGSLVSDWHVYAVEWEPGEIRFYVDDVLTKTQSFWWSSSKSRGGLGIHAAKASDLNPWPAPFDQPFYLLMNVAVGGNFPGAPNEQTRFPAELVVDYVRVYDKVGGYGEAAPRGKGQFPWHKQA